MKHGVIATFVVIVTAVSLLLTAAYTVNVNKRTSTSARAQNAGLMTNMQWKEPIGCANGLQMISVNTVSGADYVYNMHEADGSGAATGPVIAQAQIPSGGGFDIPQSRWLWSQGYHSFVVTFYDTSIGTSQSQRFGPFNLNCSTAPPPPPPGSGASCTGGVLCDGTGVIGANGQTVCGGSNIAYTCQNGTWTSAGQSCSCPAAPPPANNPPPAENPPPANNPPPEQSSGGGGQGFQSFTMYANDCANGFSGAATYGGPTYYHTMEIVNGAQDAGIGKGRLIGQSQVMSGATFTDPHAAWEAVNGPVQFYVYTVLENTDPAVSYTIHGTDGGGNPVSAAAGQPAPQPFTLNCAAQEPPPNPGEQPNPGIPDGNPACGADGQACCENDACDNDNLECRTQ